jgi:hypothetical protein
MKIIGFAISKIEAERKKPIDSKVSIKTGINIKNISSEEINISDKPSLKFDFESVLSYEPSLANITISGSVIILDDKEEGKSILDDWKKKKFEHPLKLPLYNFIMEKCTIKALQLEEDLGIPFHIPFPKLTASKEEPKKDKVSSASYAG